uniref:Uncharacterized protein n=1 Tax=Nelumbo nucifera TaxID=4432 RepID=A0A822XLU4_NELNU|nr:TPA_asm: hypothetical protein HUJ06_022803 [Nelumbo nucifera]
MATFKYYCVISFQKQVLCCEIGDCMDLSKWNPTILQNFLSNQTLGSKFSRITDLNNQSNGKD